jgi:hypothetical protein
VALVDARSQRLGAVSRLTQSPGCLLTGNNYPTGKPEHARASVGSGSSRPLAFELNDDIFAATHTAQRTPGLHIGRPARGPVLR